MASNRGNFMIIIFCFFFSVISILLWQCHARRDESSLEQGTELRSPRQLVSRGGHFVLGFYVLNGEAPGQHYLGICYTNDPDTTMLWVANRNIPIPDNSGALVLDPSGNLKITHSAGNPIGLYRHPSQNQTSSNVKFKVVLQDDGNLVLKELNPDWSEERVLWQSFDHPTDTLLPGMKLGFKDIRTNQNWVLTSWLTSYIPSNGSFTLEWEPQQHALVIKWRGMPRWSSGPLKDGGFQFNNSYNFTHVSRGDEDYVYYSAQGVRPYATKEFLEWVLASDGTIFNVKGDMLAAVTDCYGLNTDKGCLKWSLPECRVKDETFTVTSGSFVGEPKRGLDEHNSSMADCREICWKDCDCIGFTTNTSFETACQFWYKGQKFDIDVNSDSSVYIQYHKAVPKGDKSQAEPPQIDDLGSKRKGSENWIGIGIAITVAVASLLMGIICCIRRRSKKVEEEEDESNNEKQLLKLMTSDRFASSGEVESGGQGQGLKVCTFSMIMAATDNFSLENKLGEGGFGQVYKGILPEGMEIAVKRLSRSSRQGVMEFKNELVLIAELQHTNLVRLLGFCIDGEEKILIYEHMPNKSLDYFLFDPAGRLLLNWTTRFKIIEGIAQGLLYLHMYSRVKVIHRDLKANNILLDENMNPKISDFGLARIFSQNNIEANTLRIVGTYGYMSPEYAMEGIFSVKSDVFSFGVLLLEIVSGKRNNSLCNEDYPVNLVGYTWELWKRGEAKQLMDATLIDSCPTDQLLRCIQLGLVCVEDRAADRPTMQDVISMLTSENVPLPQPKSPGFYVGTVIGDANTNKIGDSKCSSRNEISISLIKGR